MSWAWIGVTCGVGASLLFIVIALLNAPGRKADDELEARELAAMRAARKTSDFSR